MHNLHLLKRAVIQALPKAVAKVGKSVTKSPFLGRGAVIPSPHLSGFKMTPLSYWAEQMSPRGIGAAGILPVEQKGMIEALESGITKAFPKSSPANIRSIVDTRHLANMERIGRGLTRRDLASYLRQARQAKHAGSKLVPSNAEAIRAAQDRLRALSGHTLPAQRQRELAEIFVPRV